MNLNLDYIKKFAKGAVTFSKKNLPSIMIGGSIIGFWTCAVMVAKSAPKAQKEIEYENAKRGEDDKELLNWKDKAVIYGKHCWGAGALGLVSTGLAIGAHRIDISRIAEMYMLSQFYKDDGEKLKQQILKKKDGEKELKELRKGAIEDQYEDEMKDIEQWVHKVPGDGATLFIDTFTGKKWRDDIVNVQNGIRTFNDRLRKAYKNEVRGPFYSSNGSPHFNEEPEVYASERADVFLEDIGEADYVLDNSPLGNLLEFRCYTDEDDLLKPSMILEYKKYRDPDTGIPAVCFIKYEEYLAPSGELLERYPG